ncbi:MAG: hypothetical protein QOI23_1444 [Chloroflexota bacterium]|nr:hypothetical protein [Chloroflexota bacterium]
MNCRTYEELAWLQVQEVPRGTENRRLARMATGTAKLGARVVGALAGFVWRRGRERPAVPSVTNSRHHA